MSSDTTLEIEPTQFRVIRDGGIIVCLRDLHGAEYRIKLDVISAAQLAQKIEGCIDATSESQH